MSTSVAGDASFGEHPVNTMTPWLSDAYTRRVTARRGDLTSPGDSNADQRQRAGLVTTATFAQRWVRATSQRRPTTVTLAGRGSGGSDQYYSVDPSSSSIHHRDRRAAHPVSDDDNADLTIPLARVFLYGTSSPHQYDDELRAELHQLERTVHFP